jgi:predicted PurR-regulated permease PerM
MSDTLLTGLRDKIATRAQWTIPVRIMAVFTVVSAIYLARAILIPIVVAILIAIFLDPLVVRLQARGLSRRLATALSVAGFLILSLALIWVCYTAVAKAAGEVPRYSAKIKETVSFLRGHAHRFETIFEEPARNGGVQRVRLEQDWGEALWAGLGPVCEAISMLGFVPFLVFFMLTQKVELKARWVRHLGSCFDTLRLDREGPLIVRGYLIGIVLTGLGLAVLQSAAFASLGLKEPVGLGLITGFLNLVPFLGLPLALSLPLAQGLLQFTSPWQFLAVAVFVSALHLFAGNYVLPRFMRGRIKIGMIAVTLGMLFWWWLWGAAGFVLAFPLTAFGHALLACNPRTAGWADFLEL